MCGIAGIISLTNERGCEPTNRGAVYSETTIPKMVEQMLHRGPDDQGTAFFQAAGLEVSLGHTRLAILDLSPAGHQPMSCEGQWGEELRAKGEGQERFWITFNGEIYNFRSLRRELGEAEEWRSESDTEVILKSYKLWGDDCLRKLRGMFALAIWDNDRQELLLARDRFGMKPLYYYSNDTLFVFASEIRTLLASGLVPRQLSRDGVASFLQSGAIESPLTIIDGVRSLQPGHSMSVKRSADKLQVQETSYATVADCGKEQRAKGEGQRGEAVALLREKLEDSVRAHLVSDVPVAAFLSGGIDSSALVALMSRVTKEPPQTFTVTFSEQGFSEESFARLIAEQYETQHHEIHLSETALLKLLPDALAAMDQPTTDGINTYVISKAVSEAGIKVALSGLGGDELFAGYPSFRRVQRLQGLASVPGSMRRAVARAGRAVVSNSVQHRKAWDLLASAGTAESAYTISRQLFSEEETTALMRREVAPTERRNGRRSPGAIERSLRDSHPRSAGIPPAPGGSLAELDWMDEINAVSLYELKGYMANTLLRDTDQMSMAHSLEVRVPFVDAEVVSFVLGLPGSWKVDGSRPKPLLLDALGELLPEKIWRRRKMGFVLPFERWMHTTLRPEMEATFARGNGLSQVGISDVGASIWQTFDRTPRRERWSRPWALYVLKRWCELNGVTL